MYRIELLLVVALGCDAAEDMPPPQISSVTPDHATPGASVRIVGKSFEEVSAVMFDATPANLGVFDEQSIMVEVPNIMAGPVAVRVLAAGRTSNDIDFRVELP